MTVFLSAFLLFQVQPLIGKAILPWFGGSAATWMACLLFFQVLLLGGYLYAHLLASRLSPRAQGLVHAAVLAASLFLLPIAPAESWKPTDASLPVARILLLLAASVGGPFFVLSTTGPLVQAWFARHFPGRSPYRLYAVSNAGSLIALVSYPFVFEPALALRVQAAAWSWGYAAFVLLCGGWALRVAFGEDAGERAAAAPVATERLDPVTVALWVGLAACGSAMLLASTNQITQDVAPVPFLWILPLSLYLLSFVVCFGERSAYRRVPVGWALALSIFAVAAVYAAHVDLPLAPQVGILAFAAFACCMACHGELALLKPAPGRLTAYYLAISAGGALGGALVTLVAPVALDSILEFPIALFACFVAWSLAKRRDALREGLLRRYGGRRARLALEASGAALLSVAAVPVATTAWRGYLGSRDVVESTRSFYGTLQILDKDGGDPRLHQRQLAHGSIVHGSQFQAADRRDVPTAYYGPESGIDLGLRTLRARRPGPLRIGVVGMGAGMVAAYAGPGDEIVYYEINADVVRLARRWFTYWDAAESRGAKVAVEIGDARLVLERELREGEPPPYDLLVVDAFSSDSIPVHLLTAECFDVYRRRVAPDGILAVHASNLYLALPAVVREQCAGLGWDAEFLVAPAESDRGTLGNEWVLASPLAANVEAVRATAATRAPWPEVGELRPWTDDFSSLFPLLK